MNKKGALFFIIDSFIAAGIIAITIVVVISTLLSGQRPDVGREVLFNYMSFFENNNLYTAPGATAKILIENKTITNPEDSLFQVVTELEENGFTLNATNLIKDITKVILDEQHCLVFNYSGKVIYEKTTNCRTKEQASFGLSRKVFTKIIRDVKTTEKELEVLAASNGETVCLASNLQCLYVTGYCVPENKVYDCLTLKQDYCGLGLNGKGNATCRDFQTAIMKGPIEIEVNLWT